MMDDMNDTCPIFGCMRENGHIPNVHCPIGWEEIDREIANGLTPEEKRAYESLQTQTRDE